MTLYTAFERTPPTERLAALVREALSVVSGLDSASAEVLAALFDADGATSEALAARARASAVEVDAALDGLQRLGYVERDGEAAWLTGRAFGLRRSVRRAGARAAVSFQRRG